MQFLINQMLVSANKYWNNTNIAVNEVLQEIILYSLSKTYLGNNCAFEDNFNEDGPWDNFSFILLKTITDKKINESLHLMCNVIQAFGLGVSYKHINVSSDQNIKIVAIDFGFDFLLNHHFKSKILKINKCNHIEVILKFKKSANKNLLIKSKTKKLPYFHEIKYLVN